MYNKLSFDQLLARKYLNQNLLQIQKRKSLHPQEKQKHIQKKHITSVVSERQIQQQNWHLVKKLIEVKHNPAFVTKMFMGEQTKSIKKQKLDKSKKTDQLRRNASVCQSTKQKQIEDENLRIKKTLENIKQSKKKSIFSLK